MEMKMNRVSHFEPKFVELMPQVLESDILYVSITYLLMVHLCACGCKEKVVLPIHPKQWRFTYNGADVTVYPSVGNIETACNSHYWITNGDVEWSANISSTEAVRKRARDQQEISRHNEKLKLNSNSQRVNKKSLWDMITTFFN